MGGLVRNGQGSLLVFRALTQGPEVGTSLRARTGFRADPSPPPKLLREALQTSTPAPGCFSVLLFPDLLVGGGLRRTRGLGPLSPPTPLAGSERLELSLLTTSGGGLELPGPRVQVAARVGAAGPREWRARRPGDSLRPCHCPEELGARGAGVRSSVHASSQASEDRFLWDSSSSFDDGNQRHLTLDGTKTYGR